MIRVRDLTKSFGSFTAVDQLNFTVEKGEVLGFLGPNGAGKTTTMRLIAGFLDQTSGNVQICGHDVTRSGRKTKQLIGYLPEGAPIYTEMRVYQFLEFIADIRQIPRSNKARCIADVIEKMELREVLFRPIRTLSKGFVRRVGLAQAILHDPDVLILDEPTDGLDPNQKSQVRRLISNISPGKAIIISTHILEEVSAVCSRAFIISNGRVILDGKPEALEAKSRYHQAVTVVFSQSFDEKIKRELLKEQAIGSLEEHFGKKAVTIFPRKAGDALYHTVDQCIKRHDWAVEAVHVERGRLEEVFHSATSGAMTMKSKKEEAVV